MMFFYHQMQYLYRYKSVRNYIHCTCNGSSGYERLYHMKVSLFTQLGLTGHTANKCYVQQ